MDSPEKLRVKVSSRPLGLGDSSGVAENENLNSTFCDFGGWLSEVGVSARIDRVTPCDCTASAVFFARDVEEASAFFGCRILSSSTHTQHETMRLTGPRHLVGLLVLPPSSRRSCSDTTSFTTGRAMGLKSRRVLGRRLVVPLPLCSSSAMRPVRLFNMTYIHRHVRMLGFSFHGE